MARSISKTQRWLDLIAFLVGRRLPVTVEQIMEGVPAYAGRWREGDDTDRATVRRTFERDKDELREAGIPLETVPFSIHFGAERQEGYRLARRDFYLPYLRIVGADLGEARPPEAGEGARPEPGEVEPRQPGAADLSLSPREAGSALDALRRVGELPAFPFRREARSAFRKLAGDLDPERMGSAPVFYADRPESEAVRSALAVLAAAIESRKRVRFTYGGIHRDVETERDVAGYGLAFQGGHWYLVGHDALRDDLRVFRVSRMDEPRPNASRPRTPDYEIPPDFRIEQAVGREPWELGAEEEGELEARVLFRFPVSLWTARNRHGTLVEERPDGSAVRRFEVRQLHPFLRWLLTFEGEAEILSPVELRGELADLAREVAAIHAGAGDARDILEEAEASADPGSSPEEGPDG